MAGAATSRVSAAELAAYTARLTAQQRAAQEWVESMLRAYAQASPGATADEWRWYGREVLGQAFQRFGDQAAAVACQQYDDTMAALGLDLDPADVSNEWDEGSLASAVGYFFSKVDDEGFDAFVTGMARKAYDHALRAANGTAIANAERPRDRRAGVRYARVPTGRETCGFCLMLASRGFAYRTRESAGYAGWGFNRFHDRCDCRVVAGVAGTEVEGYDPDWYYKVYQDARETCGSGDYNDICREIERRDPDWAWTGETPRVSYEKGARPSDDEKACARELSRHGLCVEFLREDRGYQVRTPDTKINGLKWEFKCPTGNSEKTVKNQFKSASPHGDKALQCSRLVISSLSTGRSYASIVDDVQKIFESNEFEIIQEVIVVGKSSIRRLKRKKP